jgi:hypothetical protein
MRSSDEPRRSETLAQPRAVIPLVTAVGEALPSPDHARAIFVLKEA